MGRKKKEIYVQGNLFNVSNTMSLADYKKLVADQKPKKKRVQHEKKFQGKITDLLDQLGLVWVHVKNKCFNKFYHTCPHCRKKSLAVCHATINEELTGYPDVMILIAGLELKHRSYGVKTAKLREGKQKEVCESLGEKIDIRCINEESQEDLMQFIKDTYKKVHGKDLM